MAEEISPMNPLANLPTLAEESSLIQAELGLVLLLSLAALVAIVSRRIRLPYTVALVIVGLALTLVPNPFEFDLSSELILAIIVPPLIFEATLSLKWSNLRKDLGIILILAVLGTFIGAFIVGSIIFAAGRTLVPELEWIFLAAFAFGALISATDPVAVISLFRNLGVSKRLSILVEGESLFNDGVAIVLFGIALSAGAAVVTGEGESFELGTAIFDFLRISLGGLAVGGALGYLVSSLLLKNLDDNLIETATTVALAFGAFVIAEELHVSGILSVVAAGLIVGNIGLQNTSPSTRITLDNFWEFGAFVVNSLVFLLIGLEADLRQFQLNLPLIAVAIAAVIFSRALVVYGLTWIYNRIYSRRPVSLAYRHVMFWGGLRGAISLALALSITGTTFGSEVATELLLMTFGVVLFTLLVQGTTITPLLSYLGLTDRPEHEKEQERHQALLYATRAGKRELDRLYDDGIISAEIWEAMSEVYAIEVRQQNKELRDLLHNYPELEQTMILQAREDLLQAERSALVDAVRRGLISEDVYHELIRETDFSVEALSRIQGTMSADAREE
jgi:CPA1 family monovalent cation:H+ antiporter